MKIIIVVIALILTLIAAIAVFSLIAIGWGFIGLCLPLAPLWIKAVALSAIVFTAYVTMVIGAYYVRA